MMEKRNKKTWGVIGCGWLGLSLAQSLVEKGVEVHGTTRNTEKLKTLNDRGIIGHILKEEDYFNEHEWLKNIEVLVLNIPPSSFQDYPKAMASVCEQLTSECKVIYVSSTSVYPDLNDWVDEGTPVTGQHRNGPKVAATEQVLNSLLHDRLTVLRMAGLVGGDRNPVRYMSGKNIQGGEQPVNLVHRKDCMGVIGKVVQKEFWGEVLNVCCSKHPSKKEYYEHAANQLNIPAPKFSDDHVSYKKVDNTRSKEELSYDYKYDSPFDFPKE